jgi:regulator of sigma D
MHFSQKLLLQFEDRLNQNEIQHVILAFLLKAFNILIYYSTWHFNIYNRLIQHFEGMLNEVF